MAIGPGKYDAECTYVRERTGARAVLVIVIGDTPETSGFSSQGDPDVLLRTPDMLEYMANEIRATFARGRW